METLVQIFDNFWRFWLGDYLADNDSLIQLLSVACVISLVWFLFIRPLCKIANRGSKK